MPTKPKKPSETSSSHLWVGNLPLDVTESRLTELFANHGLLDGITCYTSRGYAFVYYKRAEDAATAKNALHGFVINGNPIKIEFAKPGKPSKHVWVGGFGSSVTRENLEGVLSKFGKIEEFKFIRDRNTALVAFARLEDAAAAVKDLNGLRIGGDHIRIDFLRSHPARREQCDFHDMGSAQFKGVGVLDLSWINADIMRNCLGPTYSGIKRPEPSQLSRGLKAGHPSKFLWVGYPPSVVIGEERLHNAMILYGEIERIKCFPARHYSIVEFRSVEEARRAKEALQGRLFNDPRISIMYSNSELAPGNDFIPPYSGFGGQRPDMFGNDVPFRPPLMDMFPSSRAITPNSVPGPPGPMAGPGARPFGPRGSLDLPLAAPDFHDPNMLFTLSDLTANAPVGFNQRRKLSPPAAGLVSTAAVPSRRSYKTSGWDVIDPNQLPREPKKIRIDGPASFHGPLTKGKGDEYTVGVDQSYGAGPQFVGGPLARAHADIGLSPPDMGVAKGHVIRRVNEDRIWRGVIAKGGTPVCHARCIPIGKGLECELPEVVNCSARTGLDMLTKHYADATGFDIVFFLPDSKDDFTNYTEFLHYLGSKNRAGVAKLDDGTTLFLVPPSNFLTDILKVTGREHLYGIVLKLPQLLSGPPAAQQVHQPVPPIKHMERQLGPTQEYVAPTKELAVQTDYGGAVPDETAVPPKAPFSNASVLQDQSNDSVSSASRSTVTLTPQLIATLQAILPANAKSSVAQIAQSQLGSSTIGLSLPVSTNGKGAFPQVLDQTGHPQQFGGMYPNAPLSTHPQSFPSNLNMSSRPGPVLPESMPMQIPVYNLQEQRSFSSGPASVHPVTVQSQQFVPPTQGMQPYASEIPHSTPKGYGVVQATPAGSYGVADSQQQNNSGTLSNQFHGANLSRPEIMLPSSTGNMNSESLNLDDTERPQMGSSGVGQGTAEAEVDKNQRYQSTLQFAASLLLQIQQQQQQQASSHVGNQQ